MKKKLVMCGVLTAVCLTGCSALSKPKTAADLISKYNELEDVGNCHADLEMSLDVGIKSSDDSSISMNIPIKVGLDADIYKENLAGTMDLSLSFMGQSASQKMDVYYTKDGNSTVVYSKAKEDSYWTKQDDAGAAPTMGLDGFSDASFKNADFEYDKDDKEYIVTTKLGDMIDEDEYTEAFDSVLDSFDDLTGSNKKIADVIIDSLVDSEVEMRFNDDYYLTNVEFKGFKFEQEIEDEDILISMSMDFSIEYSDFGEIRKSDVKVPDEVIESAESGNDVDSSFGGFGGDDQFLQDAIGDAGEAVEGFGSSKSDDREEKDNDDRRDNDRKESDDREERDDRVDIRKPATVSSNPYGTYNGVDITRRSSSFNTVFGWDGWNIDYSSEYAGISDTDKAYTINNSRYGNDMYMAVTLDLNNNIVAYYVDATMVTDGNYPNMAWGAATFGSEYDDIKELYGEADDVYSGDYYVSYDYDLDSDTFISFYVYYDGGLQRVSYTTMD